MARIDTVAISAAEWARISGTASSARSTPRYAGAVLYCSSAGQPLIGETNFVRADSRDFDRDNLQGAPLWARTETGENILTVRLDEADNVTPVGGPSLKFETLIANGQSISAVVDLGNARLTRVELPAVWTAADLTFQVSSDGTTWRDLYDVSGSEYLVKASASRAVLLPLSDFIGIQYLKIRSGSSAAAVAQGGARTLTFVALP